jgi:hypothetical protein
MTKTLPDEIPVPIPSIAHNTLMLLRKLHGDIIISRWLVKIGEPIKKGDAVAELGTRNGPIICEDQYPNLSREWKYEEIGKPVALCAPESGVLAEQIVKEGERLPINENIGIIRPTSQMIESEQYVSRRFPAYKYTQYTVRGQIDRYIAMDAPYTLGGLLVTGVGIFLINWFGASTFGWVIANSILVLGAVGLVYGVYIRRKISKFWKVTLRTGGKPISLPDYYVADELDEVKKRSESDSHKFYQS